MPLVNILDRRTHKLRWKCIDAMTEGAWHDNDVGNADEAKVPSSDHTISGCHEREAISVGEAIAWASQMNEDVTLVLFDAGTLSSEAK